MKYQHPVEIPMSKDLFFDWTGERIPVASANVHGDTHPQTWADDGAIYMGTGDPSWCVVDGKNRDKEEAWPDHAAEMTGLAAEKIAGEPERFEVYRVNDMPGYIGPGGNGPKPSGMICVDGVLYYAAQNLLGMKTPSHRVNSQHGSDATIIRSFDYGKTWDPDLNGLLGAFIKEQFVDNAWKTTEAQRESYKGWKPMFPGSDFGGPSFVQFGKNNADALDDYVYALSADQWDNGRFLRLARVPKDRIMERGQWEFFSLDSRDNPSWRKDLSASTPILDIEGHVSLPEMVYIRSLNKYLLLTWGLHTDFYTPTGSELTILESDHLWGPFSLVHYEWMWYKRECCAYTPRVPLKWFNQETLEGYILHSGNWGYTAVSGAWVNPMRHYYMPQVRKFRLTVRDDPAVEKGERI